MAAWMRTAILIAALSIAAVVGSIGALWLGSPRSGLGPTILQANAPAFAAISIIIVIAIATGIGVITAKATTSASGMFIVGFTLFALAMRTQGVTEFIFSDGNSSALMIEAVGISLVILASSSIVFRIGGPLKDVPCNQNGSWDAPFSPRNIGMSMLMSLAMFPVIWIIASPSKGQVIGAAVVGGIVVGCLARKFTPHFQPILLYAAPTAVAAIGYAIATSLGISDIAFTQNTISPLLFPMPLDYAAGSIMGISIGLSWVVSTDKLRLELKVTKELD